MSGTLTPRWFIITTPRFSPWARARLHREPDCQPCEEQCDAHSNLLKMCCFTSSVHLAEAHNLPFKATLGGTLVQAGRVDERRESASPSAFLLVVVSRTRVLGRN